MSLGADTSSPTGKFMVDVIGAIAGLAEEPRAVGEVFNIGGTEEISIRALADCVIERTDSSSEVIYIPYREAYAPGFEDMRRRVPDISKVGDLLGWRPSISLTETIDTVRDSLEARIAAR